MDKLDDVSEEAISSSSETTSSDEEEKEQKISKPLENLYENFVPTPHKDKPTSSSSSSSDDLERMDYNKVVNEMESMPIQVLNKTPEVSTSEDDETETDEDELNTEPKLDDPRPSQIIQGLDRKSSGYGSGLLPAEPIIPFEGDSSSSDEEAQKKPVEKKWHIASINSDPIVNRKEQIPSMVSVKPKNKPSEESSSESSSEDEEEESVRKTAKAYR